MWLTGHWRGGEKGFPDYRSGTIGDALLIPLVVGILAGALDRIEERAPRERATAWLAGGLGAATGAAVQASWLLDSAPEPNWTLPEPHRFTVPGWYHAVFLVTASGIIAALGVAVARRTRAAGEEAREDVRRSPWLAVLLGAAIMFAGLLTLDSADSSGTSASQGTLVSVAASTAVTLAVLGWALRWRLRGAGRSLTAAALLALSACLTLSGDYPPWR